MNYHDEYQQSIEQPEIFWRKQAEQIKWYEFPETILSQDEHGFYRWFAGGKLNTSYLALDVHIEEGRADQLALVYDSPVANMQQKFTYTELRDTVAKFAGCLRNLGVEKGNRVIIYMPMIAEAVVAMLACARLGAVHSVVFGGFAPNELAVRIDDAKPKVLVTSSCGIEFTKIIEYKPLVDKALEVSKFPPENIVVLQRPQAKATMQSGRDHDWNELMSQASPADPVSLDATDPLYILYTSGTTGLPKGVVRDNGGHAVALKYSMKAVYNTDPGDVYWAGSDVGWVVGHSYIVYAPLLHGCTTIVYEGKPVRTPDAGAFWRMIAEHKINTFFTAPTAFRAVKKEDPEAKLLKQYDISSLRTLFLAGERLDPPTYEWLTEILKEAPQPGIPVVDHWWQTETGWAICSNPMGIEPQPVKNGSPTFPMPGYNVQVLDEVGEICIPGETGNIVIRLPLPPSCLPTLWNDDERFKQSYLSQYPGYYLTGDEGIKDEDGYIFVMGRTDDVINVAGHRLSTGEMEELIAGHPAVAECAVTGIDDELRGQVPVGFVVLKDGIEISQDQMQEELIEIIRREIGAVAYFRQSGIVKRLPKTRSGKILRKTIRRQAIETEVLVPPTIDDPKILDEIREVMQKRGIGRYATS
ncbi:MAG: propionyl-CoA synthetase [Deltaproteobacteria bacterium]|nr:propionyl-CoA synthetase [Deltaproteobacteria bacterium]